MIVKYFQKEITYIPTTLLGISLKIFILEIKIICVARVLIVVGIEIWNFKQSGETPIKIFKLQVTHDVN